MDREEFTEYFLKQKDSVFRLAKSILGNEDDARDVTQDIYLKFYDKIDLTEGYDNLQSVIMASTRNLCYDRLRMEKRHKEANLSIFSSNTTVCPSYSDTELATIMNDIVESLPQRQRDVFRLREIECMEISKIASTLKMNQDAVRVCLCRARGALRTQMKKILDYEQR